jgi:hypothetical protein
MKALTVTLTETQSKKETLDNILRSGTSEEVFEYLETKNIFDANLFDPSLILWKLKDLAFYQKTIKIFQNRRYFHPLVWSFSLYHQDLPTALEFFEQVNSDSTIGLSQLEIPIFEYYPYYSSRVHKFADEGKSTIRVK